MLISFFVFFALFTAVGIISAFWRKETVDDYLLASREVPAWLVGLSFGATISSGATFIGFAGLAYHSGITAICATGGIMLGDILGWFIAGDKVRSVSEAKHIRTFPTLVGKLGGQDFHKITIITSLLTIVFMGTYCAAQLVAGAKVGQALFGWDFEYFVVIGALVLLAYCWAGGIRASIWTDALQAIIIFASLAILIVSGLQAVGGVGALWTQLAVIDPGLTNPLQFKLLPVLVGWFFFGVGILGQPQLMVRHMVARSAKDIKTARGIYITWRTIVLAMAVLSGLIARLLIPEADVFDPELSIPQLWQDLLPPVLVGLLIAGLFSATMSTADSLLLAASSSLTQHLVPKWRDSYFFARIGTILIITLIVGIALFAMKGVLALVIVAWGGLAASIGPLMVVHLLGGRPSQSTALVMLFTGLGVTVLWRYGLHLDKQLMELVPGMLSGFVVYVLSSAKNRFPKQANE
ncbi:MAG: sodium/proline symporter [Alphaproteobacteria bacterium]|nr:sodium/proline symporter [Alphaproteobacteria bacterium]